MTTYSQQSGLPLPENTDPIDASATYGGFASGLDTIVVPIYANEAARDAANLASGRIAGQLCSVTQTAGLTSELQLFNGSTWEIIDATTYVIKTASTSRTTSTISADPHLAVALPAHGIYMIEANLQFGSPSSVPGAKTAWSQTGNPIISRHTIGPGLSSPSLDHYVMSRRGDDPITTEINFGVQPPTVGYGSWVKETLRVSTLGVAATLTLQWAQSTANANATTLGVNSWIQVRRIGTNA